MLPKTDCVAVPLSEKVQPPTLTKTLRAGLNFFTSAVVWNNWAGVCGSMVTISYELGSIYAKA